MAEDAPTIQFDHLMHWVPDLSAAVLAYRQLGFTMPEETGRHPANGTENTAWRIVTTYVELITVADPAVARARWGNDWSTVEATLRDGGGALRFVVLVPDVAAAVAAARSRGIRVSDPREGRVERSDGFVGTWAIADVVEGPPWRPAFINYGTPPADWPARFRALGFPRDPWRLDSLVIETPDSAVRAAWLGRVLDLEPEAREDGTWQVPLAGCTLVVKGGDADRVTNVALDGPNPPSGEIARLTYR